LAPAQQERLYADDSNEEDVMKQALFTAALSAAVFAGLGNFGAYAQVAGVFARWLGPDAPECVPVKEIGSMSRVTKLTPDQFQFARALYIAIPPISRQLPPGDSAVVASADGKAMVALVANGETCARFLAPDFILSMLDKVGKGETGVVGEGI
jgi:hypothetical protein